MHVLVSEGMRDQEVVSTRRDVKIKIFAGIVQVMHVSIRKAMLDLVLELSPSS